MASVHLRPMTTGGLRRFSVTIRIQRLGLSGWPPSVWSAVLPSNLHISHTELDELVGKPRRRVPTTGMGRGGGRESRRLVDGRETGGAAVEPRKHRHFGSMLRAARHLSTPQSLGTRRRGFPTTV